MSNGFPQPPNDPTVSGSFPFPQQPNPYGTHIVPPWAWLLLALTGAGGAGSLGSLLGSQVSREELVQLQNNVVRAESQLEKVETKIDRLDGKINDLSLQIVRNHANDGR